MDNGKIVSENKEISTYTEVDFIADLEKVSSAYLVTVIISAIIASAGVAIAVIVSVFSGLICAIIAAVYYTLAVNNILNKRLGIAYTSETGRLKITKFRGKGREECWIPRRLIWLDVTEIEDRALECDCSKSIRIIHLPRTLTRIGKDAFSSCESLERICFEGSEEEWSKIEIESELSKVAIDYCDKVAYPEKNLKKEQRKAEKRALSDRKNKSVSDEAENTSEESEK